MRSGAGRPGFRGKAEACLRLDVRELARRGTLWNGYFGTWSWAETATGRHAGSISYRIEVGAAVLSYTLNDTARSQRVPILRTPCNYGNTRPWFGCPHCGARAAVIYLRRGGFYCRKCTQVAYCSQAEADDDRAARRARKIRQRLGWPVGTYSNNGGKPKGMHWATYWRLYAQHNEAQTAALAGIQARIEALCAGVEAIRSGMPRNLAGP